MPKDYSDLLQNIILGGQDGLVHALGLSIGMAGATSSRELVLVAGVAAMLSESISMGAVAYTTARTAAKFDKKSRLDAEFSQKDASLLLAAGKRAGISEKKLSLVGGLLAKNGSEGHAQPLKRAALVWFSTMFGSFIPLSPYLLTGVERALPISLLLAFATLLVTGIFRAKETGEKWVLSGLEMVLAGGLATAAGYAIGSLLNVAV
ncbi:TPA: hypothetical protein HA225_04380 [Candidatus Micrarchaeota archaeon]|nr:hypothetical protein [Candidatus Micrarchaeota archaeon]HIH30415.1 hypothetical protein [Candidatus Micrarchaeota archaeon]